MIYRLHQEAAYEYDEAAMYYRDIDTKLEDDLFAEFERIAGLMVANPFIYRIRSKGIRRANLDRFPFYLPFIVKDETLSILAFAHHSRRPNYWIHRTSSL